MTRRRFNNQSGVLSAQILTAGTTLTSAELANLPAVVGPDIVVIVLDPESVGGAPEIAHVTAHTALATTATVLRAQESTTARTHNIGIKWKHVATVLDFETELVDNVTLASVGGKIGVKSPGRVHSVVANAAALSALTPTRGDTAFQSDTGNFFVYYGATTSWKPPWNVAWGEIDYQTITADIGPVSASTDVTGCTSTFTAVAGRKYRVTGAVAGTATVADLYMTARILTGAGAQLLAGVSQFIQNSAFTTISVDGRLTTLSGATTLKLNAIRQAGAGSFTTASSVGTRPDFILIEDIGPSASAAPAV